MTLITDTGDAQAKNSDMEHGGPINAETHYHIRWSSLDWKSFPTKEDAMQWAGRLKKPNESFDIVERDDDCERCKLSKSRTISGPEVQGH